jgi:hypothetical protein
MSLCYFFRFLLCGGLEDFLCAITKAISFSLPMLVIYIQNLLGRARYRWQVANGFGITGLFIGAR